MIEVNSARILHAIQTEPGGGVSPATAEDSVSKLGAVTGFSMITKRDEFAERISVHIHDLFERELVEWEVFIGIGHCE